MYNISKYTSNQLLSPITEVQLEGPALVPSFNSTSSKETLLRRHVKHYNHQVGFLVGLRLSGVFGKKWRFLLETPKIGSQIFLEYMSFACGSVFFFQISKLTSSLLHRSYLEGGYFWYKVVGRGTLQTWKPLACPTWVFPGHHEGEYVQSFCNWLACAEVYGPGCQRTRRNKGGMAQSWKSWCCEVDQKL